MYEAGMDIIVPEGELAGRVGRIVELEDGRAFVRVPLGEGRHAYDDIAL